MHDPLVGNVIVDDADALIVAVVFLHDLAVEFRKRVSGEWLAFLDHLVHAEFKLRELCLPENGALDALQIISQQESRVASSLICFSM